jgi:alkyl hydroperoxide reductase subunit AhpF
MSLLRAEDQAALRARFAQELEGPVRLVLFVREPSGLYLPGHDEPATGREVRQLLEEVAALSPRLHLEVHNPLVEPSLARQYEIARWPALVILPDSDGAQPDAAGRATGRIRFFGLPAGYEFATLVEDLIDVSRRRSRLSEGTRRALASLRSPLHLQVFVTPT